MYKYKTDTGKVNNNSLKPDRALQTSVMPRRSPGVLQGWRQRTESSEVRRQVSAILWEGAFVKTNSISCSVC